MKIRICDGCNDLGEFKVAAARYEDNNGQINDVCEECLKLVKELKLRWWKIEN